MTLKFKKQEKLKNICVIKGIEIVITELEKTYNRH